MAKSADGKITDKPKAEPKVVIVDNLTLPKKEKK